MIKKSRIYISVFYKKVIIDLGMYFVCKNMYWKVSIGVLTLYLILFINKQ